MAIQTMDNPIDSKISLNRPIPGSSLTSDPDSPAPWEKPPEFVNLEESLKYLLDIITQKETYSALMDMISKGTPLMEITQVLLFQGFTEGKWNPDLMMILAEPLCYLLLALAERADIDAVIYNGEDEEDDEEVQMFHGADISKEKLKRIGEAARKNTIPSGALPKSIEEELEDIEVSSLLSQPEQAIEDNVNSLLGRNET